jgi:hypothetical protein
VARKVEGFPFLVVVPSTIEDFMSAIESGAEVERSCLFVPWGGIRRRSGFTVLLISECCKLTGLTPAWL